MKRPLIPLCQQCFARAERTSKRILFCRIAYVVARRVGYAVQGH